MSPQARRLMSVLGLIVVGTVACGGRSDQTDGQTPTAPSASTTSAAEVRIERCIDAINTAASQLVVGGRTIKVTAATEIRDAIARRVLGDLRLGDLVEVRGRAEGTTLVATRIELKVPAGSPPTGPNPTPQPGPQIEFTGTITSLDGTTPGATLVVAGRTVRTNADTVVRRRGDPVGFDRMRVGQRVEIKGLQQSDGSVLATRITLEED